jgi:outer membrane protein TolC
MIAMKENEIRQKNFAINTLMNTDKNFLFDIDTTFQIKNYEINIPDSALFQNSRSDLKALDKSADILRYKQTMESIKRKPDFGIRYNNMTPFSTGPNFFTVMGMMTIPIVPWSSKEYKANVKGLDFEITELQWEKQIIINETTGKLGTIIFSIKNSKQQIKIYNESIIPALQNNLNTSQLAYGQNKESLFVVLDAWEALNMARTEYLSKIEELLYLQVEYEKELEQK